ncbi:MAG TPA: CoA transferase, partial [Ilumatobacteraceae bacterium]
MSSNHRVRVIEHGGAGAAVAATQFAATGADVIRVVDTSCPRTERSPIAALHAEHLRRGKREVFVDLSSGAGRDAFLRLASTADVVIDHDDERALPDQVRAMVRTAAADAVQIEISTFGATGARRDLRGGELMAQSSGGYAVLCGEPDREPLRLAGQPFTHLTGVAAFIWGHAALRARDMGAAPARIDLSIEDTVAANLEYALSLYAWMGLCKRRGPTYPFAYPHDLFAVADGLVELTLGTREAMLMLGIAVDEVSLADAVGLDTEYQRIVRRAEFDTLVAGPLGRMTRQQFFDRTTEVRMPTGYVVEPTEIAALPPITSRHAIASSGFPWSPLVAPSDRTAAGMPEPIRVDIDAAIAERPLPPSRQPPEPGAPTTPVAPLAGVRVLDLTLFYAGPTATRILAELGAEVIRVSSVQSPGRGLGLGLMTDYERGDDPWNGSFYYFDRYAGKKEVTLDLTTSEGMDLFRGLLAASDVLVTNFSPRALRYMKLDPLDLCATDPRLIVSQISGYGATGAWTDLPAVGPGVEALAGLAFANGYADGPPLLPGTAIADAIAGYWAAAAVVQRLAAREQSGAGGVADVSMLEGCLAIFPEPSLDPHHAERTRRTGNDDGHGVLAGIFAGAGDERWVAIEVDDEDGWRAAAAVLGATDEPGVNPADRTERGAWVAEATAVRDAFELADALQAAGVAAAVARDARDVIGDQHLWQREVLAMVDHPGRGTRPMTRQLPGMCAELMVGISGREPTIGEHNAQ